MTRRVKRCFVCSFRALHLLASHDCLFTGGKVISLSVDTQKSRTLKKNGTKKKKNRQTRFKNWALQVHLCTFCIADELIVLVQHVQHQSSLLLHSFSLHCDYKLRKLQFFLANSAPCLFCGSKQPIGSLPKASDSLKATRGLLLSAGQYLPIVLTSAYDPCNDLLMLKC